MAYNNRMKSCTNPKCEQTNPQLLTNFSKCRGAKDGLQHRCKTCQRVAQQIYQTTPEYKLKRKLHYHTDENQKRLSKNLSRTWDLRLKRNYGITSLEYDELLSQQDNSCAICQNSAIDNGKRLAVDHCHVTGKVRGLLCHKCNNAIGLLYDSSKVLFRAFEYLKRFE